MPELPDVTVYVERLRAFTVGQPLEKMRIPGPFLLRTADPPLREIEGKKVLSVERMGKRIIFSLEGDLYLAIHLMIAGRLRWKERGAAVPARVGLAAFDFPNGTLILTEQDSHKRAALHLLRGPEGLAQMERGGLEVLAASLEDFTRVLRSESHTLKRSLTDPDLYSGIGNAYSDEILHAAKLSPVRLSRAVTDEEAQRLYEATQSTLLRFLEILRDEVGDGFPDKVTAFRHDMAVHGRYGKPCPVCGTPIQHIVYAENECNYCPTCQTGGNLLADRSLSRLLREDWPKTLDQLEQRRVELKSRTKPS